MFVKYMDFLKRQDNLAVPYRATVVYNQDPLKLGRVKCRVPGLIEETDTDKLPWILPENRALLGGAGDSSEFGVPQINSEIVVEFPYKDPHFGFYTGAWQSELTHQSLFNEDYPYSYGWRDSQGTHQKTNMAKGYSEFRHASGSSQRYEEDGEVKLKSKKGIRFISEDEQTEMFFDLNTGVVSFFPKGKFELGGPIVTINPAKLEENVGQIVRNVTGSVEETVTGGKKTKVGGSKSESVVGNVALSSSGSEDKLIAGESIETYGEGQQRSCVLGDLSDEVIVGDHIIEVKVGDIEHKTLAGSAELGNALASIKAGIAGNVDIDSILTIAITAAAMISVDAALVRLGKGTGPVVTMLTSPFVDLLTGTPQLGVPTVLAG
jgi:hypothetical protein